MSARSEICRRIEEVGIVPVIRLPSAELALRAAEAVFAGGIPIFEITLTVPDAVGLIRVLADRYASRALVGAGTVLGADEARACIDAGARFIVSPGTDLPTIEAARARDVPIMPGALTPTEVMNAWKAGADMVKIFPCSALGGAKYLRALKAPLPHVKLLPTGGVNLETAADYLAAGAAALGIGSELVDPAVVSAGRDDVVRERAEQLIAIVREARTRQASR
jgi:2-dehydro-3-deoxyphosphogluconate aldolase / (4S)-4-hydroxy-2-oxoglutarate aldolase